MVSKNIFLVISIDFDSQSALWPYSKFGSSVSNFQSPSLRKSRQNHLYASSISESNAGFDLRLRKSCLILIKDSQNPYSKRYIEVSINSTIFDIHHTVICKDPRQTNRSVGIISIKPHVRVFFVSHLILFN